MSVMVNTSGEAGRCGQWCLMGSSKERVPFRNKGKEGPSSEAA